MYPIGKKRSFRMVHYDIYMSGYGIFISNSGDPRLDDSQGNGILTPLYEFVSNFPRSVFSGTVL